MVPCLTAGSAGPREQAALVTATVPSLEIKLLSSRSLLQRHHLPPLPPGQQPPAPRSGSSSATARGPSVRGPTPCSPPARPRDARRARQLRLTARGARARRVQQRPCLPRPPACARGAGPTRRRWSPTPARVSVGGIRTRRRGPARVPPFHGPEPGVDDVAASRGDPRGSPPSSVPDP